MVIQAIQSYEKNGNLSIFNKCNKAISRPVALDTVCADDL